MPATAYAVHRRTAGPSRKEHSREGQSENLSRTPGHRCVVYPGGVAVGVQPTDQVLYANPCAVDSHTTTDAHSCTYIQFHSLADAYPDDDTQLYPDTYVNRDADLDTRADSHLCPHRSRRG